MKWLSPSETWLCFSGLMALFSWTGGSFSQEYTQEMENLNGILIATTNLTKNLDKAFERRFLYKIEFGKPELETRRALWQSMLPELSKNDADLLASRFDFSGGQIENILRKRQVDLVLEGKEPSLDALIAYCKDESMIKETGLRIGFTG
jgi:AAA+ superfamily predicted ATPase